VTADDFQTPSPGTPSLTGTTIGRFTIGMCLGAGGMGEVYQAEDTQLKRTVAIKRLKPTGQKAGRDELLKEARRASALNHPRIASVYDVFPDGNELFLVMEYIDGQTLRRRMDSPITIPEFCEIALQSAEALAAAHEKGILHGDVKPANIMLTQKGEVKVCDFGLSRRVYSTATADTASVRLGLAGTPAYMSPEVLEERTVDLRADIFSLGVVFYEMLTNTNPFAVKALLGTMDRIRTYTPESLDHVNPAVPPKLAAIVSKMIEKDPESRYSQMQEVITDLREVKQSLVAIERPGKRSRRNRPWLVVAAVLIVLVVATLVVKRIQPRTPSEVMNMAVLPFDVSRLDRDKQFFTYGLTDILNEQLSRLTLNRKLQIASAAETRARKVTNPQEARQQLGANIALGGSVEYLGDQIRITCSLIETASGRTLRSETVTVPATDVFGLEDQVLNAVLRLMGISLNAT
jgi:eukaryotic-like serine/threonine-protein kinase